MNAGRNNYDECIVAADGFFQTIHDGDMFRQCALQIVRALIANVHEEGCGTSVHKAVYATVHACCMPFAPAEAFRQGV